MPIQSMAGSSWLSTERAAAAQAAPAHDPFAELRPPLDDGVALLEAERCLECGGPYAPAPCVLACPAAVDVPAFMTAIMRGEPAAGGDVVFAANLLGGTCARVCPVEVLCEGACVLNAEGRRPVAIGRLQRYVTDHALARGGPVRRRRADVECRIAVIGAGPAGLVCAGELAALGYVVTVYDEAEEPGGLVTSAIAPYRQWRDPLPAETRRIANVGVRFRLGRAVDAELLREIEQQSDAVFLGIGLGADMDVGYPGVSLSGVWSALPFIERIKRGDPPRVGQAVAVIGGGNTAIDVARAAVRLGAADVTILYRRTEAELPAYPHEVVEAREEGVRFQWLVSPVRFLGDSRITGIECQYMRLGEPDRSGRRSAQPVAGTEFVLPVDTVVKAIGQQPRAELVSWLGLEIDGGRIRVDAATGQTTNRKYFAGGDAVGGATVVEAVRGAKIAARGIDQMLAGIGE